MITYQLSQWEKLNYLFYSIPSKIYLGLLLTGLALTTGLTGPSDFQLVYYAFMDVTRTEAVITKVFETPIDDYDSSFEYIFSYEVEGEVYTGNCYSPFSEGEQGEKAIVEYVRDKPWISRILGTDNQPYNMSKFVAGIILILISLIGFSYSRKKLKRLEKILKKAAIVRTFKGEADATYMEINDTPVLEITYYYEVDSVPYKIFRYNKDENTAFEMQQVLYAVDDPGESVLLLNLPSGIEDKVKELNG